MSQYEGWSLVLTGIYDLLTLFLLGLVAYEAFIRPKLPDLLLSLEGTPLDTEQWSWSKKTIDLVIDNRGHELRNVLITSDPDELGWRNLGLADLTTQKTSEHFSSPIPYLRKGEKKQLGWCDVESNRAVFEKPFSICVEYDNPAFPFPRRLSRKYEFNLMLNKDLIRGLNRRFDLHNVAEECCRLRHQLEKVTDIQKELRDKETNSKEKPA